MIQSTSDSTHLLDGSIEGLSVTPDCMQVFMFSAVTWNRHHIHYNREQAIEEGLPDVVVQRGLIGNFLARMLNRWIDGRGEVRRLKWQMRRSAVPGQALHCRGEITGREDEGQDELVSCRLWIEDDQGEEVAFGEAQVRLPLPPLREATV